MSSAITARKERPGARRRKAKQRQNDAYKDREAAYSAAYRKLQKKNVKLLEDDVARLEEALARERRAHERTRQRVAELELALLAAAADEEEREQAGPMDGAIVAAGREPPRPETAMPAANSNTAVVLPSDRYAACAAACDRLMASPDFDKLVGMSRPDFDALYAEVAEPIKNTTTRGTERIQKRDSKVGDVHQLLMFLFWLRQYPTGVLMNFMFCVDWLYLRRKLFRISEALYKHFCDLGETCEEDHFPSDDFFHNTWQATEKFRNEGFGTAVCVMDGTYFPVRRPTGEVDESLWCYKHRSFVLQSLVVVLLTGVIIWASNPSGGSNDQGRWNEANLREQFVGKPWGIMADGGFTPNTVDTPAEEQINAYTPQRHEKRAPSVANHNKKNPKIPLTESQKAHNKLLSQTRVVVENTFAHLKKFRILSTAFRSYFAARKNAKKKNYFDFNKLYRICIALTNRRFSAHAAPRAADWVTPARRNTQLFIRPQPTQNASDVVAVVPTQPILPVPQYTHQQLGSMFYLSAPPLAPSMAIVPH